MPARFDTPGVQDYALKRQMLARVRQFMHAHLSTLPISRQAEVQVEARQFSRVAEAIEEDLSRLDQVLKAQARRSAPVVRQLEPSTNPTDGACHARR